MSREREDQMGRCKAWGALHRVVMQTRKSDLSLALASTHGPRAKKKRDNHEVVAFRFGAPASRSTNRYGV